MTNNMSGDRKEQWERVRSGAPLNPPQEGPISPLLETHHNGLISQGLWEQLKDQQERQEQLYSETQLGTHATLCQLTY